MYEISVTEGDGFIVRMAIGVAYPGESLLADAVRIDRAASSSFEYDKNGNLTKETDTRGYATDYAFDALNRQTFVTFPDPDGPGGNGRLQTKSIYDGYGNVIQTVENRGTATTADDRVNVFEYDKRNRLTTETTNSTGAAAQQLVTNYEYDAVGNETLMTDPSGVETNYRYDKLDRVIDEYQNFGDGRPSQAVDQVFAFTGREWDKDAELQHNRARWYDPSTGRFLTEDPSGLDGGDANFYRYVGNNPINFTDPTGLVQAGNPLDALFGQPSVSVPSGLTERAHIRPKSNRVADFWCVSRTSRNGQ